MAEITFCEFCNNTVMVHENVYHHLTIKDNKNCLEIRERDEYLAVDRNVGHDNNIPENLDK